jgi:HEAT repeat protein
LVRRLLDKSERVRISAGGSLQILGAPAVPELLGVLAGQPGELRNRVAEILAGMYGTGGVPPSGNNFLRLTNDSDELQQLRARGLVNLRGQNCEPLVARLLGAATLDACTEVRIAAIRALAGAPVPGAFLTFNNRLQDASPEVRAVAAHALGELGSAGRPGLRRLRVLAGDEEGTVRAAADRAIAQITSAESSETGPRQ